MQLKSVSTQNQNINFSINNQSTNEVKFSVFSRCRLSHSTFLRVLCLQTTLSELRAWLHGEFQPALKFRSAHRAEILLWLHARFQPGRKTQISVGKFTEVRKHRVLSIMPKIPEISVRIQMERSVSVSSDRNIRHHFWRWSTYFGWNIPIEIRRSIFDKPVLCPN